MQLLCTTRTLTLASAAATFVAFASVQTTYAQSGSESSTNRQGTADPSAVKRSGTPLERTISIQIRNMPVVTALEEIARKADVRMMYYADMFPANHKVTVVSDKITVNDALHQILAGTELTLNVTSSGTIMLVRPGNSSASSQKAQGTGGIVGQVVDSSTGRPLSQATVRLVGTKLATTTSDSGAYILRNIPTGKYRIEYRSLGYFSKFVEHEVKSGSVQGMPVVKLAASATTLSEVVTTVTGQQRKLEVGNDITRLDALEIRRTADIKSLTDLLATRVPGLDAITNGGVAGAQTRLRIRGINSFSLNNDPILIVDGVRMQNIGPSGESIKSLTSRLNDIDPTMIETIEVVKGPSASTLYGTDAANGVIVITTKRGKPGVTRWTIEANTRFSEIPRKFPGQGTAWGRNFGSDDPVQCSATLLSLGLCAVQDSVSVYSALNDPKRSTIGNGHDRDVGISVSTGSQTMQTFLSARATDVLGVTKMPDATVERVMNLKGYVPSWARRPNAQQSVFVNGNFTLQPTSWVDVGISLGGSNLNTRNGGNGTGGSALSTGSDSANWGVSSLYVLERREETQRRYRAGSNVNARPTQWLSSRLSLGLDYGITEGDEWSRAEDCLAVDCTTAKGTRNVAQSNASSYSADGNATITTPLADRIRLSSAFGFQFSRRRSTEMIIQGSQMAPGVSNPAMAPKIQTFNHVDENATVGVYWEERLALGERLFLTGAIRRDAGSAFGDNIQAPIYPKFDASWVALRDPIQIPWIGPLNTVRLRFAYGQSGVQPPSGQVNASIKLKQSWFDGATHPAYLYDKLGNADLKPERSGEIEGGIDMTFGENMLDLGFTYFRRTSKDAIITRPLLGSTGFTFMRYENVGSVRNAGFNVTAGMRLIDTRSISWSLNANLAHTTNKLLSLGNATQSTGSIASTRLVPGYPLFGVWGHPLLGYADRNGDGALSGDEILVGDTMVFVGWSQPKYTVNYSTTVTLFGGNLSLSSSLSQVNGRTQNPTFLPLSGESALGELEDQALSAAELRAQTVSSLTWGSANVSVRLPQRILNRAKASSGTVSISVSNLGLWTNYRGNDPNVVSNPSSDTSNDQGAVPNARSWALRFNLGF